MVVVQTNDLSGLSSRFHSSLPCGGELLYVWVEEDVEGLVWVAVGLDVERVEEGLVGDPPQGVVDALVQLWSTLNRTVFQCVLGWRSVRARHGMSACGLMQHRKNAARLTRTQEEQLKEALSLPPSESGVTAGLWDAPATSAIASWEVLVRRYISAARTAVRGVRILGTRATSSSPTTSSTRRLNCVLSRPVITLIHDGSLLRGSVCNLILSDQRVVTCLARRATHFPHAPLNHLPGLSR